MIYLKKFVSLVFLVLVCVAYSYAEYEQNMAEHFSHGGEYEEYGVPVEHHQEHGAHPAISYQSFQLESKNPVPVVYKKEYHESESHYENRGGYH
ncbi:hypothetical protein RUM44_013996 [Polyplax serrata]|uniref:Uncharacterized protein n=1 Tax=Polyplax serrata TaxID=468196 RepID=A0ABR1BFQ5_POLSC